MCFSQMDCRQMHCAQSYYLKTKTTIIIIITFVILQSQPVNIRIQLARHQRILCELP